MRFRFAGFSLAAALCAAALTTPALHAQQTGGSQPGFTFGGSGIPTNFVITNNNSISTGFTLGLSATERCSSICGATVTNDGVSTFNAAAGAPFSPLHPLYGSWNVDFGVLGTTSNDNFKLLYSINGGPFGTWNLGTDLMDSDNLGFGMFTIGGPVAGGGSITPPSGWVGFDPNANAQYDFMLEALNKETGGLDASVYACVDVGTNSAACSAPSTSVTPEPATMSLMAMGLVGMAGTGLRRRKNKKLSS